MKKILNKDLRVVLLSLLWILPARAYEVKNLTQLTFGPLEESGCTFNSTGTKIAYRYLHHPYFWANCDIWVMNTNGSGKTRITTDSRGEFNPSFAPDGRIAYTKEFGSNDYDIWIANADGSNPHQLIDGPLRQGGGGHCWHPSGQKLAYTDEYMRDAGEIWTANADGSGKVKLTSHISHGYHQDKPRYSRSGDLIAYANSATRGAPPHVWVMNTNGSGKQQITFGSAGQYPMFWWPDDSRIGYTQNGELWLHDLTTDTDELLLVRPNWSIDWADLSPDGTKLVFDLSDGIVGHQHIWVGDVVSEPEPELTANWYGPEPGAVKMGESYKIHASIFSDERWLGGTIKVKLEETAYYPADGWNSGNDELLNDSGRWACYVDTSEFGLGPWVLADKDYEIGSEEIEIYVPARGGSILPIANLYFEGSHKWAWIRPAKLSFIGHCISALTSGALDGLVSGGFGSFLVWEAYQETVDSCVQLVQYSYTGYCNGVTEEHFGHATVSPIPLYKQFALAESAGFALTGSFPTAVGLAMLSTPAAPLAGPFFLEQLGFFLISEGLYIIAADPPNMDYTSITTPEILLIPEIQEIEDSEFRAATLSVFELEAVIRALKDSMEKYEGAKLDAAIEWKVIQLAAANYYTREAQDMTNNLATFWEGAVSDLPVPTPEQIQQARDWIVENGLPHIEVNVLLALGHTQEEIDELAGVIASMDDTYFERIDKLPDLLKVAAEGLEEIANKMPSVPESSAIEAVVDVRPDVLNLKSEGLWATCYIELPEGYDVSEIDVSSLMLQNTLNAEIWPIEIGDYDNDGIPDLMARFERELLVKVLEPIEEGQEILLALTGKLVDGTNFAGIGMLTVISEPEQVDDLVGVSVGRVGYDRRTGQFSVNVTVTNTSATVIKSPVWLVIESISSPSVTVANADGTTYDGKPYLNLSGLLGDGQLDPGESVITRVYFNNPSRVRFTFEPSVRGVILP